MADNNRSDIAILLPAAERAADHPDERKRRELLVMQVGPHLIGVFAEEVDSVSECPRPTPLPDAPPAVLGVICVHDRMWTIIDSLPLLDTAERPAHGATVRPCFAVALRGDEQLALAAERIDGVCEIDVAALEPAGRTGGRVVRGIVRKGPAPIIVLDPEHIFETATRAMERRRRRS